MREPVICFGQQPNGFFPKGFFYAKVETARKLQKKIGGKIVFFYHDSDADYRETITIFVDPKTGEEVRLNFNTKNKIQKKYSPLYIKKILSEWQDEIVRKLPRFMDEKLINIFKQAQGLTVADFCLDMYKRLGLLDGIEVMRSSDPGFRMKADDLKEFFADVPYQNEIVRAEMFNGKLRLHEGGGKYFDIESPAVIEKYQKNPARDERFAWMQSVIHATHYVAGVGENGYLKKDNFPDVIFVERDAIEKSEYAYIPD
ncbi:MAG: hypothetical protein WCI76_00025 [bacterium]